MRTGTKDRAAVVDSSVILLRVARRCIRAHRELAGDLRRHLWPGEIALDEQPRDDPVGAGVAGCKPGVLEGGLKSTVIPLSIGPNGVTSSGDGLAHDAEPD